MSHETNLEQHLQKNLLSTKELLIRNESLNREVEDLFNELKVSPEQLSSFIENKENFTEENWQYLQKERQLQQEKLLLELLNIRNPLKAKKTFTERAVPQHWLFVR